MGVLNPTFVPINERKLASSCVERPLNIFSRAGTKVILVHLIRNEQMNLKRIFPFAVVIFAATQLAAQSPSPTTLIKAGRLLDPHSGNVLSPAALLIENRKIKEIGPPPQVQAHAPNDVKIFDLGSATLLPGLIDGHTHLLLDIIVPPEAEAQRHENGTFEPGLVLAIVESPSKRVLLGAQMAREDLESGITTVRNLGHSGVDGDTELRDAIKAARVPGPRILASARKLTTRGDYVQNLNPDSCRRYLAAGILVDRRNRPCTAGSPAKRVPERRSHQGFGG